MPMRRFFPLRTRDYTTMQIECVQIENLRSIKSETINFNSYTCLVGPNGSGKSTVLCALNIFFRHSEGTSVNPDCLELEDFHLKNTNDPVRITVTFTDLLAVTSSGPLPSPWPISSVTLRPMTRMVDLGQLAMIVFYLYRRRVPASARAPRSEAPGIPPQLTDHPCDGPFGGSVQSAAPRTVGWSSSFDRNNPGSHARNIRQ